MQYRRARTKGGTYFFTVVMYKRGVGWVKRVNRTIGIIHRQMVFGENDDGELGAERNPTIVN